jgi:hypothetical protein
LKRERAVCLNHSTRVGFPTNSFEKFAQRCRTASIGTSETTAV